MEHMSLDNIQEIDELLLFLMFQLKKKNKGLGIYRTQKALFKIKMELGNEHPLYDSLPYYWYFYGPNSDLVKDSYNNNSKYLTSNKLNDNTYHKLEDSQFKIISAYPELEKIVKKLLDNIDYFFDKLQHEIYIKYAPYECMYPFKFKIFDIAEQQANPNYINFNNFIDTLFDCEATLPVNRYFNEYSNIFSDFITKLDLMNEENQLEKNWSILRTPIQELWYTFAYGLRVKHKDNFYTINEKPWDLAFKNKIKEINSYISQAEDKIDLKNTKSSIDYTPFQKEILTSTLGNYLKE